MCAIEVMEFHFQFVKMPLFSELSVYKRQTWGVNPDGSKAVCHLISKATLHMNIATFIDNRKIL